MKRVIILILSIIFVYIFYVSTLDSPVTPSATYTVTSTHNFAKTVLYDPPRVEVIAENLTIPWEILFLPDGELLVTERPGRVLLLKQGIEIAVPGVHHIGEGGLLGAALHPEFIENNYVYLFQTTKSGTGLTNRINRYILEDDKLIFNRTIVTDLPGARYHDGGRIKFGPDGLLYVTVGDTTKEEMAQNPLELAGSILRFTDTGMVPEDNPFQNPVYSFGHRNPQGIVWDVDQNLWSTEHGRSGLFSGYDELNLITSGSNYGWPKVQGDEYISEAVSPKKHSGADTTWAPGGLTYLDGSLYFTGLHGEALYEAVIVDNEITDFYTHLYGEYGRLRTVVVGPDSLLYITTSNQDGRGDPGVADDRIVRVNPDKLTR